MASPLHSRQHPCPVPGNGMLRTGKFLQLGVEDFPQGVKNGQENSLSKHGPFQSTCPDCDAPKM